MNPVIKITSNSPQETLDIGKAIAGKICRGDIICLFGSLGSGKTHLVKGIAAGLGADSRGVNSPSFVLLKQYPGRLVLNHFDLYRLKKIEDILAIGFDEYVYSDDISVIEWAQRLSGCLPEEFLRIDLSIIGKSSRGFKFSALGNRYNKILKHVSLFKNQ